MKITKKIFLFLLLYSSFSYSQITTEKQSLLLQTFSFIQEQQITLEYIRLNFQKHSIDATLAQLEFSKNYSSAIDKIDAEVKNIFGEEINDYLERLKSTLGDYLSSKKMTEKDVMHYIDEVNSRAKGKIKSPFLEVLLKYKYLENPIGEFLNGNINIHSVKSYSNTKKIELSVKIPRSWKEIDGVFPLVLKKFRSDYGTGNEIITISIDRFNYQKNNRLNANDSLTKKMLLKIAPKNSKIISAYSKKIDNQLTGILEYEEINPKIGSNQKRVVIQYLFLFQNNLFRVDCTTYGKKSEKVNARFERFKQLYLNIFKSIHLKNNNKNIIALYKN